jgi:hypothetical protein
MKNLYKTNVFDKENNKNIGYQVIIGALSSILLFIVIMIIFYFTSGQNKVNNPSQSNNTTPTQASSPTPSQPATSNQPTINPSPTNSLTREPVNTSTPSQTKIETYGNVTSIIENAKSTFNVVAPSNITYKYKTSCDTGDKAPEVDIDIQGYVVNLEKQASNAEQAEKLITDFLKQFDTTNWKENDCYTMAAPIFKRGYKNNNDGKRVIVEWSGGAQSTDPTQVRIKVYYQ